ncbi:SAF domain-containing protein [Streptomyces tauricus]|uniref:SAF domain-containing protein n=1 Tax=Streptomyces tauricus TaxID=68274 RepID=UPI00224357F5|nr:SAF domain-containing protein [Streptomyces tauricus]MCW8101676.1 SAF domain-containing protein [Streptomyces tauricus]
MPVLLVLVTLIGALGGAVVVARAGNRVDVLAVARDVPIGQQVAAQDVKVVSFADDPGLSPIPATQRASVVGQRAAVDLHPGELLTRSQLRTRGGLGDTDQVVGVELKRGFVPRGELRPGDKVAAVVLRAQGADSGATGSGAAGSEVPDTIDATVKSVGTPDSTGALVVNLVVAPADGPLLATKAAAKQIALVRQPRQSGS